MKLLDILTESVKISRGQQYSVIEAKYRPTNNYIDNKFVIPNDILGTNFGKFLISGLQSSYTTRSSTILRNAGLRMLKKFNIPKIHDVIRPSRPTKPELGWTGSYLYTDNLNGEDLIHEISHWVVTSSIHRKEPDFGMGTGFNSTKVTTSTRDSIANRHEEMMAISYECCLYKSIHADFLEPIAISDIYSGVPQDAIEDLKDKYPNLTTKDVYKYVYFQHDPLRRLSKAFDDLISIGLITQTGVPTWAVRISESVIEWKSIIMENMRLYPSKLEKTSGYSNGIYVSVFPHNWISGEYDTNHPHYDSIYQDSLTNPNIKLPMNTEYRPELNIDMSNNNMIDMLDKIGFGKHYDGYLIPIDEFIGKGIEWLKQNKDHTDIHIKYFSRNILKAIKMAQTGEKLGATHISVG